MDKSVEELLENKAYNAAYDLAEECAKLYAGNPFEINALDNMMTTLMTELWDRGFSQAQIKTAFCVALEDMQRYTAGTERNGSKPHPLNSD